MLNKWNLVSESEPRYQHILMSIAFKVTDGQQQLKCAVSWSALTDYCKVEDTKENALNVFHDILDQVLVAATNVIKSGKTIDGYYYIGSEGLS